MTASLLQSTKTVLVVEDEPVTSALLKEFLSHLGLHARFAANGVEAVALLEKRSPDLILLDLNMPKNGRAGSLAVGPKPLALRASLWCVGPNRSDR